MRRSIWLFNIMAIIFGGIVTWCLLMSFSSNVGNGPIAPRSVCRHRLQDISLALENYHDKYGSFPPAWVADENGKRLYSWRVLILPFLDQRPIYDLIHLDEPWDSPHNMQYLQADLTIFKCPDNEHGPATTNYVAVLSEHGPWRGAEAVSKDELGELPDGVLFVVEQHGEKIHWAEPRDLDLATLPLHINDDSGHGIGSPHDGGANVSLLKNGRVEFLEDSMSPGELRKRLELSPER